jgi:hypothetical protein
MPLLTELIAFEDIYRMSAWMDLQSYLFDAPALIAVAIPGTLSLAIIGLYGKAGRISTRLQLLWLLSLPIALACTRWSYTAEIHELYIYSAFSVACLLVLHKRMYVSPVLVYALSFLSLCAVDVVSAFWHALRWQLPLGTFYYGVGGAGIQDSLFVIPLFTAAAAAYAIARMRSKRLALSEF